MLLRSSSTPVIGSLLSSLAESPNKHNLNLSELHDITKQHLPSSTHKNPTKLSCSNSLLVSPLVSATTNSTSSETGLRRVQSEGSLKELANGLCNVDEFTLSEKISRKTSSMDKFFKYYDSEQMQENVTTFKVENLVIDEVRRNLRVYGHSEMGRVGKLYLATGLGVLDMSFVDIVAANNAGGRGGGGNYMPVDFYHDRGDHNVHTIDEHYKRMLDGDPGNSLFLSNYAQFLYETKGDLAAAEDYYYRAVSADPEDGEILSQYAKLIWEVHGDRDRSANYFERSVQASPGDSNVQAAYAKFLWDTEEDEGEDVKEEKFTKSSCLAQSLSHSKMIASLTV